MAAMQPAADYPPDFVPSNPEDYRRDYVPPSSPPPPPPGPGGYGDPSWDGAPIRVPFVVPGDGVTRQLCAGAHLMGAFADHVHNELIEPAHQAVAPNWNIDTVTLARHAEQARARRSSRDLLLLLEFAIMLAVGELALLALLTRRLSLAGFIATVLLGIALAYLVAYAIVWRHYSEVHRSAVAVMGHKGFDAIEPDPLDPRVEAALATAQRANVVLFSGTPPFVGAGTLLDRHSLTVNMTLGRLGADGNRETPEPFDGLDLHRAMLQAVLNTLPPGIKPAPVGGHRLYVLGGNAPSVGGLFRSGPVEPDAGAAISFRRPVSTVTDEVMDGYLREAVPAARPYTYVQLSAWDGQVIVTLFLRVAVRSPFLFVEISVCALRPLQDQFGDVATIPLGPGVHRLPVVRTVLPNVFPLLFGSPTRALEGLRGGRAEVKARKDLEKTLARRGDVNFSAGPSLREQVAKDGNSNHFGYMDEEQYYRLLNRRAMDCLREYLDERNIDLGEFDKQAGLILEKTITNAREIYGPKD